MYTKFVLTKDDVVTLVALLHELIRQVNDIKDPKISNNIFNFMYANFDSDDIKLFKSVHNILDNISVKKIILNEKINELFKNLKYNNKFSEIYNEYGKINEYLTLEVFFKLMDNMGETEFIKKLENEIYQLKNSDELIKYKTESVLSVLSGEDSFSFIDYYVRNIENYKKVIE